MSFLSGFFKRKNHYHDYKIKDYVIHSFTEKLKNSDIEGYDEENKIFEIYEEFKPFFEDYNKFLKKQLSDKKNPLLKKYFNHFLRINLLYNEIYHYGYFMNKQMYFDAYQSQRAFLNNKLFVNILRNNTEEHVYKQVLTSIKIKLMLTILCFRSVQNISKQQMDYDFQQYYQDIKDHVFQSKNKKNVRFFYLIEIFKYYLDKDETMTNIYLSYLFHYEKKKYQDRYYAIPLQYTGLGNYPHITMPLPVDFKSFLNEKLVESKFSITELRQMEKEHKEPKKDSKLFTGSVFSN